MLLLHTGPDPGMAGCRLEYVRVSQCPLVGYTYARIHRVCTGPGRWAPVIIQTARRNSHRVTRPAGPLPPSIMRPAEILPLCLAFRFRVFGVFTPQKVPVEKIFTFWPPFYGATVLHWQLLAST